MTVSDLPPRLAITASATVASLSNVTVTVKINTKALIDTGSTVSFISEDVVKKRALQIRPDIKNISMATGDLVKETKGLVVVDLDFKGIRYKEIKLAILPNLCSEVILGHEFRIPNFSI